MARSGAKKTAAWAALLLCACACDQSTRSRAQASAPPASGDDVHVPLPTTLPAVWALEDLGAEVEVRRLKRPATGGPACAHSPACLLLLPVLALHAALPDEYDLATVTRGGRLEASVAFDTEGRFLWATRSDSGWTHEYGRLALPRLGKRYLLEQRRFREGPDGARLDERPTPVDPQTGVLAAYALALSDAPPERAVDLLTEALQSLGDEAAPLLDDLAHPGRADAVLARLVPSTCGRPLTEAACQRLLAAAFVRRELDSALAALDTRQLRAAHDVPACAEETTARFRAEAQHYAFFDAWHAQQALAEACRWRPFDEAAAAVGAPRLPPPGRALVEALASLKPPVAPPDAPLTRVLFLSVCEGPRWRDATSGVRDLVRVLPGRQREAPDERSDCHPARRLLARQAAGLSSPVRDVERLLASPGEERAVFLALLDARDSQDRALLARAVRADLSASGVALGRLAVVAEVAGDLELSAADLEAIVDAYGRAEACHAAPGCAYDVRLQAAALRLLARRSPVLPARRLANAAARRSLEAQAVAALPLVVAGDSDAAALVARALVARALADLAQPGVPRPGWTSYAEVTNRTQLLAFAQGL